MNGTRIFERKRPNTSRLPKLGERSEPRFKELPKLSRLPRIAAEARSTGLQRTGWRSIP